MFRRGFATIAGNRGGGSLKDIQTQLRHGSITTTANIYVQPVEESVREVGGKRGPLIPKGSRGRSQ